MRLQLLGGIMALGMMTAGCGLAPSMAVMPVASSLIASRQVVSLAADSLVITSATTRETADVTGAYRTIFTVGGQDRATPFTLVVETYNPGSLFVSKLTGVTLNGQPLQDKAARKQWSDRLYQAINTSQSAFQLTISEAANYLPANFWTGKSLSLQGK